MGINSTEVSYGFGQLGSVYTTASSDAITPPTNKVFVAITMLEDTVFNALTPTDTTNGYGVNITAGGSSSGRYILRLAEGGGSEKLRVDSSGRVMIGTTTEGFGTADDLTIATSGDTGITIRSGTSNKGNIFFSDSTSGTDEFKGQVQYDHDIDALILHSNATERMRLDSNGAVSVGSSANTYGGSILAANGYYVCAFNGDNLVTNASQGGGSATLYIGNAAIQVSSDQRIKKDIVDTTLDATTKLKQVRVVDFKWNDPTDKAEVNRNSRGTWTGCLAQEMVNVFPYTVNAPRKADNSIDTESERTWGLEYQHLVPALIKGFQEQQAEIETLKTKVAALEAA